MTVVAFLLVVITSMASIGVAFWFWRTAAAFGEELGEWIGAEEVHAQDSRTPPPPQG